MKYKDLPIFPTLLLIAMAVGAYFIYNNLEFEEREYPSGQTEVARKNMHLAAVRLLGEEGFSFSVAEDRSVFSTLDINTTSVLWIANINELSSRQEVDQLLSWIEAGGVLLTSPAYEAAYSESTVSAEFLERIGTRAFEEDELEQYLDRPDLISNTNTESYALLIPDASGVLVPRYLYSYDDPYFKNIPSYGSDMETIIDSPYLLHKRIGKGFVSIYTDYYMFDNEDIGLLDHEYLLLWLTQPAKQKTISLVFTPAEKPGLFEVIWDNFSIAVLIMGIALIGFLRWASSRIGPIEQELPPIQNNIMAHLEARGEYWYRHKHLDKMTNNIQVAALENLQRKKMNDGEQNRTTTIKQATELVKCTSALAEDALYGQVYSDDQLLNASRTLQKINHRKPTIRNNKIE